MARPSQRGPAYASDHTFWGATLQGLSQAASAGSRGGVTRAQPWVGSRLRGVGQAGAACASLGLVPAQGRLGPRVQDSFGLVQREWGLCIPNTAHLLARCSILWSGEAGQWGREARARRNPRGRSFHVDPTCYGKKMTRPAVGLGSQRPGTASVKPMCQGVSPCRKVAAQGSYILPLATLL